MNNIEIKNRSIKNKDSNKIDFRCKRCNQKLMEYTIQFEDDNIVLAKGLSMCCHRCKRVFILKKYTEAMVKTQAPDGTMTI